jgi:hypothetical protein
VEPVKELIAEKIQAQKDRVALRESIRLKVKAERDKAKVVKDGS